MAINIKELFVTDLDPNSGAWWSTAKVDKINYNFNQLSNGGMSGPQGTIGEDGGFGIAGVEGNQGPIGPQGYQGPQPDQILNDWVFVPEANGLPGHLFPRKNPIDITQSAPVSLRIGYISADDEYNIGVNPIEPIQIVNLKVQNIGEPDGILGVGKHLRVENGEARGYDFYFGSSTYDSANPIFNIFPGIPDSDFKIVLTAQNIVFWTGTIDISMVDSIKITDAQITIDTGEDIGPAFNLSNNLDKFTKSKEFRFTPGATTNKVLVSSNGDGDVEWKNVKDVFRTFPIGSIISIRQSDFIPAHFWLDVVNNVTPLSPLNNIYGRGKIGTDYEGWYLCNGETWETEEGFDPYLTPNLNGFSYEIDRNGNGQGAVTGLEPSPVLIGGYDMKIQATVNSDGVYSIQYTTPFLNNNTSPGTNVIAMSTGSGLYYTSRMIHIVYLENPELKWSKP